jgi:hypothetical protein
MKNSKQCPKCKSADIYKITGDGYNAIDVGFSQVTLYRYICCDCGYTEEFVEKEKDFEKIKNSKSFSKII